MKYRGTHQVMKTRRGTHHQVVVGDGDGSDAGAAGGGGGDGDVIGGVEEEGRVVVAVDVDGDGGGVDGGPRRRAQVTCRDGQLQNNSGQ